MKKIIPGILLVAMLTSCWSSKKEEVLGYAPVYGDTAKLKTITLGAPQSLQNGGKIYVYGATLYQVEAGKGIHITDISNPSTPVKKGFLNVIGCQELAIKDNLVFTNNMKDLVILKIDNNSVTTLRRLPNTFKFLFNYAMPPERGKFECPDPTKGVIIGWQKKTLINPNCSF